MAGHTEKIPASALNSVPPEHIQQDLLALHQPICASPLQELHDPNLEHAGIRLLVKRDDLIHPCFGGNKWRKLKYHIDAMKLQGSNTLLTFGGAWSNHIYATAAAGKYFGFHSIGIIRGEPGPVPSTTLEFARACGMQLHYISRSEYRNRESVTFIEKLSHLYGPKIVTPYIVPEGGKGLAGMQGCIDIIEEIDQPFDIICCSCGTGTSLAGIITGLERSEQYQSASAIGFSALKIPDPAKKNSPLADDIRTLLEEYESSNQPTHNAPAHHCQWYIETDYHFGGYANINDDLIAFIRQFHDHHGIMLDAVYTGKMFYGLYRKIESKEFARGTTIVAVHSGGLQGNRGFNL